MGEGCAPAVASVWRTPDLVQRILHFCYWGDFLRVRAVNKVAERVSHRPMHYWYWWLTHLGKQRHGRPVVLKTVPLRLQVLRQASKKVEKRLHTDMRNMQIMVEVAQRKLLRAREVLGYRENQQILFTESLVLHADAKRRIDTEFDTRKRLRIDISNGFVGEDD